jgi:hypothetical protein
MMMVVQSFERKDPKLTVKSWKVGRRWLSSSNVGLMLDVPYSNPKSMRGTSVV